MIFNCRSNLSMAGNVKRVALIVLIIALLFSGCPSNGSGEVSLNQRGSSPEGATKKKVPLNNCGGKETAKTTLERSLDISIEGSVGVAVNVLEAKLRAEYARGQTSSIELPAGEGTNMEFVVEWTKESYFGDITVDGESGQATYLVSVETPNLISSVDRGCISGVYRLVRWDEAPSLITLYMEVDSGSLTIDPSGDTKWTLAIRSSADGHPSPQPAIECNGRFYDSSQELEGLPDGSALNWTDNMYSKYYDLWLAFCGSDPRGYTDPFTLYPRELGVGKRILEMKNSKGTLIWEQ